MQRIGRVFRVAGRQGENGCNIIGF